MRKIQTKYTKFPINALAFIGDSLSLNFVWGTLAYEFYPAVLQEKLQNLDCNVLVRNFGISGQTSTQMKARKGCLTQFSKNKIVGIYAGTNDPSNGISAATTTQNIKDIALEQLQLGAKVIVCLEHYNNYSTGDTTATPSGSTLTLWNAQKQAYTDLVATYPNQIIFCDFYGYMRNLINTGVVTQGDASAWNVADGNIHLNANGEKTLAEALLKTIQDNGWINDLK